MSTGTCDSFRKGCGPLWHRLTAHPFVVEMAAGELPPEKFRFYIEQNIQYLPDYARVLAMGAAKSRDRAELSRFTRSLAQIVDFELDQNAELLRRVLDLGAGDRGGSDGKAPATVAYTSWLMATGATGGPLEVLTAIMPCAWSYSEIALAFPQPAPHPVYREWLTFFGSEEYSLYVRELRHELDVALAGAAEHEQRRLAEIFRMGARLELEFWDMGYGMRDWPDRITAATATVHG